MKAPARTAKNLGRWDWLTVARSCASRRKGSRPHDHLVDSEVKVDISTEPEEVVLPLRSRVDPAPLIPAEGPFAVVSSNDVLAELWADELKEEAKMPEQRPSAKDRMTLLIQVPDDKPGENAGKNDDDPEACTHANPSYQWQLQRSNDLELRTDVTSHRAKLLDLVNTLPLANLLLCD
jgi:hypothetical protein